MQYLVELLLSCFWVFCFYLYLPITPFLSFSHFLVCAEQDSGSALERSVQSSAAWWGRYRWPPLIKRATHYKEETAPSLLWRWEPGSVGVWVCVDLGKYVVICLCFHFVYLGFRWQETRGECALWGVCRSKRGSKRTNGLSKGDFSHSTSHHSYHYWYWLVCNRIPTGKTQKHCNTANIVSFANIVQLMLRSYFMKCVVNMVIKIPNI